MNQYQFTYKGHQCIIEIDYEEDNIKAFHFVVKPDGTRLWADISPYDSTKETVKLWIDAGYPERIGYGPLHREDLKQMIEEKQLAEMFDDDGE